MTDPAPPPPTLPRLVISGAGGVVGRHLVAAARGRYRVTVLTRSVDGDEPEGASALAWQPDAAERGDGAALDALAAALEGARAVVHLAGASIAGGRLDEAHKRRVLRSRVDSTRTLVEAQRRCRVPPAVWFQASATGIYGDRGDEVLTETAEPGSDFFLADVGRAWEAAAAPAAERSRLVIGRFGLVLAEDAPAWQRMLLPVRLFVGGPLGSGEQWFSWIDADDLARAVLFTIENESCEGVYNFTTPDPVRQKTLAREAAARLGRPALMPAPAPLLRLVLGDLADALLLASARVVPERLAAAGFVFERPEIGVELDALLT